MAQLLDDLTKQSEITINPQQLKTYRITYIPNEKFLSSSSDSKTSESGTDKSVPTGPKKKMA
jgi:hypothetical protein